MERALGRIKIYVTVRAQLARKQVSNHESKKPLHSAIALDAMKSIVFTCQHCVIDMFARVHRTTTVATSEPQESSQFIQNFRALNTLLTFGCGY